MTTTVVEVLTRRSDGALSTDASSDPFRYGWRYTKVEHPDGLYEMRQEALTLEDILHPREGDQVTHSDAHQRRRRYLCNVFEAQLAQDASAVVLDDVRIAWDVPDLKPHDPDISVIIGVVQRQNWSTFDVAREGVRPALIVEITSPETASIDRSNKLEEYDIAGVPLYVLVDTVVLRRQPMLRLLGYTQTAHGYQVLVPNEHGWLWLAPVQLWLGVTQNELVCYNSAGEPLGDYQALAAALAAESAAREAAERAHAAAEQRAAVAEARLQELEAELRRLQGSDRSGG
ncbi:MAG: Uma2 family endonuclease [Candidatus Viridilinea halotolerans]|uniref:Uma2 family endonuclease n=1 Tax=Candidatus Viridilinea halotolerans TaxID=2491704 RepID=A0A426TWK3_9CHLR|nr:MAG: Uma2 family endonuclease [Candidatus Viridilinea halotolerans]